MSHEQAASKALEFLKPLTISEETDEEDVDEPVTVESDAAFETRLAAFLDDDCPTLADAAGDLGRLGVERRTYLELQDKVDDPRVAARLEAIDAFEDEILENTSSWSVESLAVCRHENALLAKKARAMAGWLSAVHGSSSDEKMIIYEEAASALAKEIESPRGGWRAACTLAKWRYK